MIRDLTEAQYFSLPLVSSKDRVVGMKAIFVHTNLKNSPVSILTATGQYAKLAKEALGDLQALTVNAVEAEFRKARGAVMQAALSRLGELD